MAKRGPKTGHIKRREQHAEKRGMAKAFGVSREVSKREGLISRNVRYFTSRGIV